MTAISTSFSALLCVLDSFGMNRFFGLQLVIISPQANNIKRFFNWMNVSVRRESPLDSGCIWDKKY